MAEETKPNSEQLGQDVQPITVAQSLAESTEAESTQFVDIPTDGQRSIKDLWVVRVYDGISKALMGLLTDTQKTDLTDAGDSTLHYHATDRDSDNFTGTEWIDLTDSGVTTLHSHASTDIWTKLDETALTGNATSITTSTFSAKTYLKVTIHLVGFSDVDTVDIQFNGDTAQLYASVVTDSGGGGSSSNNKTQVEKAMGGVSEQGNRYATYNIVNVATQRKMGEGVSAIATYNEGDPEQMSNISTVGFLWNDTTNQITSIKVFSHGGAVTFGAGSRITVIGHN